MKIDPHVHLRDWPSQRHKETMEHGFSVAWRSGLSAVFEMPNTDPPLVSRDVLLSRIETADKVLEKLRFSLFHGILAGVTAEPLQVKEVVRLWKELFPRVAGLKMFAGHSTGNMGLVDPPDQRKVFKILAEEDYRGVLMVHCEKESLLKPDLFDPERPWTYLDARPPEAEVESVRDQIRWAKETGYRGTLHVCHVSVPESLKVIEMGRKKSLFRITCGITPHHALLSTGDMKGREGILLKVNPPLREKKMQEEMLSALLDKRIDWIETDHAPHTKSEKIEKRLSGIPVLQFYGKFIEILKKRGLEDKEIRKLTFDNIVRTFNFPENILKANPGIQDISPGEYGFDPFVNAGKWY
jgi:dihydroorotase